MAVVLPLTRQEFNITEQLKFKQSVARAAGVSSDDVTIDRVLDMNSSIPILRRLLTTGIRVDTSVQAPTEVAVSSILTSLTPDSLNSGLVGVGLPAAAILEPERESGSSPTNTIYITLASVRQVTTTPLSTPAVIAAPKSEPGSNLAAVIGGAVGGVAVCIIVLCVCLYSLQGKSQRT